MILFPPGQSKRRWLLMVLAAAGAGLAGVTSARKLQPTITPDHAVSTFQGLSLPDPTGKPIEMSRFAGRPLVVNFWATWCPPCVEEMPELSALYKERKAKGLQMIGIGIDSAAKVADFATKSPVAYPLAVAGLSGTEMARAFGNATGGLPFTVLIDRHGRIAQRIPGRVKIDALRSAIDALDR